MTDILFLLVALLSEVLGTIGGFGSSMFLVSLGQFLYPLQTILALTALLHVFSNSSKLLLFRKAVDLKLLVWMGVPSLLLVILGSWLGTKVTLTWADLLLSLFLVGFAIFMLTNPNFKVSPTPSNAILGGSVAGFLAGLVGTGGAIRGAVMAGFNLEKSAFVATSAAIDWAVDASRLGIYLLAGYLSRDFLWLVLPLAGTAFLGSWLGKRILSRMPQESFRILVLVLILLVGLTTLLRVYLEATDYRLLQALIG